MHPRVEPTTANCLNQYNFKLYSKYVSIYPQISVSLILVREESFAKMETTTEITASDHGVPQPQPMHLQYILYP